MVIYLQINGFNSLYKMDISDLEDVFRERPELGRQVSDVYASLYRLGGGSRHSRNSSSLPNSSTL